MNDLAIHEVVEFSVLSERPGESDFFDQPVRKNLTVDSQQRFLDECLEMVHNTDPGMLEKIIRRGLFQYVGLGQALTVDSGLMEAAYLQSLVGAEIISRLQAQKISAGHLPGAANLFTAITVKATTEFYKCFAELFTKYVTASLKPIEELDGARLIYRDGSMISLLNDKSDVVVMKWAANSQQQWLNHVPHGEQTKHGLVAALELYMGDRQVTAQYATVLAMRFNLDLNLVPVDERHLLLERDLGL